MNCRRLSAGVTQRVLLALNKERKERPPPLTRLPPLNTGDPGCQRGGSRRPHPGPLLQLPPRPRDAQQPKFHHQKQPRWVNKLVLLTSNAPQSQERRRERSGEKQPSVCLPCSWWKCHSHSIQVNLCSRYNSGNLHGGLLLRTDFRVTVLEQSLLILLKPFFFFHPWGKPSGYWIQWHLKTHWKCN